MKLNTQVIAKRAESKPSFMPIAIVRAVTVELCELGKPPQAMH